MYEDFAYVYDKLMTDASYKERADYILSLFEEYDRKPTLFLDLCCGTGTFAGEFAKKGISVIGVDISEDMLSLAREKSAKENTDILYLCQDATELDLYGTVDGAVCLMDSINHITDYDCLKKAIAKVSLFLEKDRIFIFDVNTHYKSREILGNNTFVSEENGVYLVWQNEYNEDERLNSIYLDFFTENEDGTYSRTTDFIEEKDYSAKEIDTAIKEAGLETVAILDDMKKTPPTDKSQRVFYITRKL